MAVYSADNGDRGRVFLDGVELKHVIEVDTCASYAVYSPMDEDGDLILDYIRQEVVLACAFGDIKFIPNE